MHCRSATALPAVETYVPAAQLLHVVQLAAFVVVLKVPLAQPPQVRFAVALPPFVTYCPALQSVCATHAVEGSPSLSQVPLAHGTAAAVPPAQ